MPSLEPELGDDFLKQFRKVVVSAGPLKGARYPEVSWEDLRKAARSYKQDPRFNQYAKRMMSEKALGRTSSSSEPSASWRQKCHEWLLWGWSKAKGRFGLFCFLSLLVFLLLSRPLFYVVMAKGTAVTVRLMLRRSIGFLVTILDAILDEAAAHLEASLLTAPAPNTAHPSVTGPAFDIQQPLSFHAYFMHAVFTILGLVLGRHMPRAHQPVRQLHLRQRQP